MTESIKRRTLMKGIAWATPTAAVVVAAPVYAASQPAADVQFTGDLGVGDECWGAVYTYRVATESPRGSDDPPTRGVEPSFGAYTNNVGVAYAGEQPPAVTNFTLTLYLNTAADVLSTWEDEYAGDSYGDEGTWSSLTRKPDVQYNGQTFAVYEATYTGEFISEDGVIKPVDAGWSGDAPRDTDPDDVSKVEGPIAFSDAYQANKGAVVLSADIDGQHVESASLGDALKAQGTGTWFNRNVEYAECRYVGSGNEEDIVIPCEGEPGAPDPYPHYNRPVERSTHGSCTPLGDA